LNILVVEDNFLVAEMLRMAVEDAGFTVIGPAKNVEDSTRLATGTRLDGALLDIQLSGSHSFPLARLLKMNGVPFIFVSGYDASIIPSDLQGSPMMGKPVFVGEITRLAAQSFTKSAQAPVVTAEGAASARVAQLRERIAGTEARMVTQRRRIDRLKFQGSDPADVEIATDLLEQMATSVEIMHAKLSMIEDPSAPHTNDRLAGPIDDEVIYLEDPCSVEAWSARLDIPTAILMKIGEEVGPSARTILRAFHRQVRTGGNPRKSSL